MLVYTILLAIIIICWPKDLFAWGPGTHLEIGLDIIKNMTLFSPVILPFLKKYPSQFLYGMVAADVLFAKKYAGALEHSHNWDMGWKILDACKDDKERSSAYGYLTHLSADIVAHNYYIPYMTIKSFETIMKKHTYWELRYDMHVDDKVWNKVKEIVKGDFDSFDNILDRVLFRPFFSFKTNKKIFSTVLLTQQLKQLRNTVKIHSALSLWPLTSEEVAYYRELTMGMVNDFLKNLDKASCLKGDPSGLTREKESLAIRKALKRVSKEGLVNKEQIEKYIALVKVKLEKDLLSPRQELPGFI